MRKLVYLLVFIIVIAASIPFIDGYLYKQEYIKVMNGITDKYSDKNIKFEILEYHLGWLNSTVKSRIKVTDPETLKYMPDGFTIIDNISHGPIVRDTATNQYKLGFANIVSKTYLPRAAQAILMPGQPDQPIEINILAGFNNVWISRVAPIRFTIPTVGTIQLGESIGTITFSMQNNTLNTYNIKSDIGAISFTSINPAIPSFSVQPSQASIDSNRYTDNFWNSSSKLAIPGSSITWADSTQLAFNGISTDMQNRVDANNMIQVDCKLDIKNITAPLFFISNFSGIKSSFGIHNINYAGIENYSKTKMDAESSIKNLNKLLTANSSIDFGLSFNSNLGALLSSFKLSFNPLPDSSEISLMDAAKAINLDANIKLADPLLLQLVIKYLERTDAYSAQQMPAGPPTNDTTPSDPTRDLTATLLREGKITLQQSLDIFGVISAKPDEQGFSQKVSAITPENASQLTQAYRGTLAANVQAASSKPVPVAPEQRARNMILEWEQSGYLIKENNDYTISIISTAEGAKINGKVVSPPLAAPAPSGSIPTTSPALQWPST